MQKIISKAYKNAKKITINYNSKIILFSDCHRGDNSYADDFAHNRAIYFHALRDYFNDNYTYIELGDGTELWENLNFNLIFKAHKNIFMLLKEFYLDNRLHMIWGNHDMTLKNPKKAEKLLGSYFDEITGTHKELFKGLVFNEAIILEPEGFSKNIFLLHGHQADFFNYTFWKLSRFLVYILWKPLQILGIKDPTSPAKNYKELVKVEKCLKKWIENNNKQMVIAGHTHRPRFPNPEEIPYFNDGSCVHPRSITGIEITNMQITLVKWHTISRKNGTLQVVKTVLEGPKNLALYLNKKSTP